MRKTLVVFFWLLATIGLTYVTNAAVKLVDLQVLPEGSRIEVLSLPKTTIESEDEVGAEDDSDSVSSITTTPPSPQPVPTSSTSSVPDNKSTATSTTIPVEEEIKPQITVSPVTTTLNLGGGLPVDTEDGTNSQNENSDGISESTDVDIAESTVEVIEPLTPVTTTTQSPVARPPEIIVEPILVETISLPKVQIGENYQAQLEATGGIMPYRWEIQSGSLPEGLNFSENGLIAGVLTSGVQEQLIFKVIDEENSNAISKELMLENTKTRQTVIARGGTAFIDIDGDYVSLFLVSPADGYSAVIVEPGGFRVEVQFVPQIGDSTSFVVCESNEGLKCSSD